MNNSSNAAAAVAQRIVDSDADTNSPTLKPLNVAAHFADMVKTPITRPRISGGCVQLHQGLRHRLNPSSTEARDEQ